MKAEGIENSLMIKTKEHYVDFFCLLVLVEGVVCLASVFCLGFSNQPRKLKKLKKE